MAAPGTRAAVGPSGRSSGGGGALRRGLPSGRRAPLRSLRLCAASAEPGAEVPQAPAAPAAPEAPAAAPEAAEAAASGAPVTVEYQRQAAREMVEWFKAQKFEKTAAEGAGIGWVPKAELANGRWVMMGLMIGLLTEYSTGVNFIDQLKLLVTNLGIADLE